MKNINEKYRLASLCVIHFLLWGLLPAILRTNLPMDSREAVAWSMHWMWGAAKDPYLTALLSGLINRWDNFSYYYPTQQQIASGGVLFLWVTGLGMRSMLQKNIRI